MSEREKMEAQTAAFQNTDDADPALVLAAVRHCASLWVGEARLLGDVRAKDIVRAIDAIRSAATPAPGYAQGFEAVDRAIATFLEDPEWQQCGLGIEDKRRRMRAAIAALPAPDGVEDATHRALTRLIDVSEAFLRYFNPATDLSSDKENQWWSVYDQIKQARTILAKPAQESGS